MRVEKFYKYFYIILDNMVLSEYNIYIFVSYVYLCINNEYFLV